MNKVYLIGFMGCGKTAIGKRLSFALRIPFYDMDKEIVKQQGMSIPDIFEKHGEPYFRNLETEFLKTFRNEFCIISTGGGVAMSEENQKIMRSTGLVLFLNAAFSDIWMRIHKDKNRPIVQRSTKEEIENLYQVRYPTYKKTAHISVRTEGKTLKQITEYCAYQVNRLKNEQF